MSDGNGNSATYSYLANSPLVSQIAFKQGGTMRMTTIKQFDYLNRLRQIASAPGASGALPFSYNYNYNSANQRTKSTLADGSFWEYQYDTLGQVTNGVKHFADGTLVPGQQFGYLFDDIGNRKQTATGGDQSGAGLRPATYTVNSLNQITSREFCETNDIIGAALVGNSVSVNGKTNTFRKGEYFSAVVGTNNIDSPAWLCVTVVSGGKTNTGNIYFPQTPEQFNYDADGNRTNDGRLNYQWDAENRITQFERLANAPASARGKVECQYDYRSRRTQKIVSSWTGSAYVGQSTNRFIYDGWNLIGILDATNGLDRSFTWGTDLSGSMQGAGGIGGLISMTLHHGTNAGTYFYCFDGNGNVTALVNAASGEVAARYEYDLFLGILRATGPLAYLNPFLGSTKFYDWETGLYYYGYRYYDPLTGTWPSRDPREEKRGGKNLYSFVNNHPINSYDVLGLYSVDSCQTSVDRIMNNPGASSRELRKVLAAINAIPGCEPLKPKCMCCTGDDNKNWVGYVQGKNLNICANNIKDTALLLETLVHENIHVLQKCRKKDLSSCDGAVCTEIQAALNDGTCQRTSPGDVRSCVINEAANSAQNRCGSREDARKRAEELYDQCNAKMP